jgi:hypothetical protein
MYMERVAFSITRKPHLSELKINCDDPDQWYHGCRSCLFLVTSYRFVLMQNIERMTIVHQMKRMWPKATIIALAMLFFATMAPPVQRVSAQSCRQLSAYTDVYNGKAILYVWYGMQQPIANKFSIVYKGQVPEWVPAPSDWGIRTDAPQISHRDGGWWGYYIATRWITEFPPVPKNEHYNWNDDWRWVVQYC